MSLSENTERPLGFFDLVADISKQEMEWVGVEPWKDSVETAMHVEAVRRVQQWTFERIARNTEAGAMREMFEGLALGVARISSTDLALGEPGADG